VELYWVFSVVEPFDVAHFEFDDFGVWDGFNVRLGALFGDTSVGSGVSF